MNPERVLSKLHLITSANMEYRENKNWKWGSYIKIGQLHCQLRMQHKTRQHSGTQNDQWYMQKPHKMQNNSFT